MNNQSTRVVSNQVSHIAAQDTNESSLTEEKTHSLSEQKVTEPNLSLKELNIEQEHSNDRTVLNSNNRLDGASREGDRNTQVESSSSVNKTDSELGKITLPATSFQFQAEYKRMKNDMKAFYYYFKVGLLRYSYLMIRTVDIPCPTCLTWSHFIQKS